MSAVERFPYRDRDPASGGLDLMPGLPIVLRRQTHSLSAVALVDSGASISVLPHSLGVQLGFDWNTQKADITLAGTLAHVGARWVRDLADKVGVSYHRFKDWVKKGYVPIRKVARRGNLVIWADAEERDGARRADPGGGGPGDDAVGAADARDRAARDGASPLPRGHRPQCARRGRRPAEPMV
jgi:hypothetical protein